MPKPQSELPNNQVTANPDLEKRTRRRFSTEYKLRILTEADACQHGELGGLLRREKLYSSQLTTWRQYLSNTCREIPVGTPNTALDWIPVGTPSTALDPHKLIQYVIQCR